MISLNWLNSSFFVQEDKITLLQKTIENVRKNVAGRIFVDLQQAFPEGTAIEDKRAIFECLQANPNLFTIEHEGQLLLAKRAHRIAAHGMKKDGVRTNSLVSTLSILSIELLTCPSILN